MAKKKSAKPKSAAKGESQPGAKEKKPARAKPKAARPKAAKPNAAKPKAARRTKGLEAPAGEIDAVSEIDAVNERLSHFDTSISEAEFVRARVLPVSRDVAYNRARMALLQETENLRRRPGFLFADVGYKFTDGRRTDFVAVRMHVDKKSTEGGCWEKTCYNGYVPTDVIVSNFALAIGPTDAGARVTSDGNQGEFGTLGMGVNLPLLGKSMLLTCAHVVSKVQPPASQSNFVIDVNNRDIGLSSNLNSDLYRFDGLFDVAILYPRDELTNEERGKFTADLPIGVATPNRFGSVSSADLNRVVFKIGANEPRVSKGFIDSVDHLPIPVSDPPGTPNLLDHILIRSTATPGENAPAGGGFANRGDSGAMVFTEDGTIIGMVRAVYDDNEDNEGDRAIVTRITNIADEFGIQPLV